MKFGKNMETDGMSVYDKAMYKLQNVEGGLVIGVDLTEKENENGEKEYFILGVLSPKDLYDQLIDKVLLAQEIRNKSHEMASQDEDLSIAA